MTGFINPTYQSASPQDLPSSMDIFKQDIFKNFNCMRPGQIISFNAANQTAIIRIAQQQVTSIAPDGTETTAEFPQLSQVPVIFPSGGGFTLTFPIAAGDECIVLFNDRQLDKWKQSGAGQPPNISRFHDFSDGIAIVGMRNFSRSLGGVSTSTTQLRNDAGNTYVEIANGGIVNVVAPTTINLLSPIVNISGVLNVENLGSSSTPCNINGTVIATGDVQSLSGVHRLSTHVHGGVQTGAGDTGGPIG